MLAAEAEAAEAASRLVEALVAAARSGALPLDRLPQVQEARAEANKARAREAEARAEADEARAREAGARAEAGKARAQAAEARAEAAEAGAQAAKADKLRVRWRAAAAHRASNGHHDTSDGLGQRRQPFAAAAAPSWTDAPARAWAGAPADALADAPLLADSGAFVGALEQEAAGAAALEGGTKEHVDEDDPTTRVHRPGGPPGARG